MTLTVNVETGDLVRSLSCKAAWIGFLVTALIALAAPMAKAASPWVKSHKVETRLVAGAVPGAAGLERFVGVEMRLAPNWKTYWRNPGDAGGIPPIFEIPLTGNIAQIDVLYPTPKRYIEPGIGVTFGYKESVVFPIRVTLRDPNAPTRLAMNAHFGVCEEICIPVSAQLTHTFGPADFNVLPTGLRLALDRVPRPGSEAAPDSGVPAIARLEARLEGKAPHILVHATGGSGQPADDLFPLNAEDNLFGVPKALSDAGAGSETRVFKVPVLTEPPHKALHKGAFQFVVVGPNGATRTTLSLSR